MATIPPGYPDIDFDRAVRIATEGVPLAGHFENSFASVRTRERHDNASLTPDVLGEVCKNISRVCIPDDAMTDIRLLRSFLAPTKHQHLWTRPIGLLIQRSPTMTPKSDASYNGLGGWALEHPCIWPLSKSDIESCGFILPKGKEPTDAEKDNKLFDHINILEFVAVIINVWIAVRYLMAQPVRNAQVIFNVCRTTLRLYRGCSMRLAPSAQPYAISPNFFKPCSPIVLCLFAFRESTSPARKPHSGPSVSFLTGPIVGVRYRANVPNPRSLQTLPSPARAAVQACALAQVRRERGDVRSPNDATVDSRARIFTKRLTHLAFNDESLQTLTSGQALPLLGAFIARRGRK